MDLDKYSGAPPMLCQQPAVYFSTDSRVAAPCEQAFTLTHMDARIAFLSRIRDLVLREWMYL